MAGQKIKKSPGKKKFLREIEFLAVLHFFAQFKNRSLTIFEIAKKWNLVKKNLIALFDFTSFLVGTFLILWRPTVQCDLFFF